MSSIGDPLTSSLLVVNLVLVALVVVLLLRMRGLARRLAGSGGDPRALDRLAATERELSAAVRRLDHLGGRVDRLGDQTARCLQHVGLVRYDAFKGLGGQLSFSVALLDARQDGVVLSVLNARDGARAYAKPVTGGQSTFTLSEEEQRAISET